METIKPNSYYLFCEGFAALGGLFLRLSSTAFLGCFWAPPLNLCRFPGIEFPEENSFLGDWKILFPGTPFSSEWRGSEEHMRMWTRIRANRAAKALQLVFMNAT